MSRPSVEQVARVLDPDAFGPIGHVPDWARGYAAQNKARERREAESQARAVLALFEPEAVTTAAELAALEVNG